MCLNEIDLMRMFCQNVTQRKSYSSFRKDHAVRAPIMFRRIASPVHIATVHEKIPRGRGEI